ncbi:unnamed protein product [Allacma fusca]|uniref:Uncharacterized protein n=1 Tax=Allacma fusca TaxID=39272 RepID=A0A8J2PUE3_9HEXA|nr:unnamed protein product [Allacma fusca]
MEKLDDYYESLFDEEEFRYIGVGKVWRWILSPEKIYTYTSGCTRLSEYLNIPALPSYQRPATFFTKNNRRHRLETRSFQFETFEAPHVIGTLKSQRSPGTVTTSGISSVE